MSEYVWVCLYKLDSEYSSGRKYAKILNMLKYGRDIQHSEYARVHALTEFWIYLGRYLGFYICQDSKYARVVNMQELHKVLNMPEYNWICLNWTWIGLNMSEFLIIDKFLKMYHTMYSARSLYKLISTYSEIGVFRIRWKI